jgi:tRNA threonylcarbamoyladenosine biosynthesis protein TsaE
VIEKPLAENLNQISLELQGESLMLQFGNSIASAVSVTLSEKRPAAQSLLIALSGDLGAGKTTISRGILNGLGHSGSVKSPTYTLVEPYELPLGRVCHFDFYRLIDPEELEYMGFRDYLVEASLCLIEWPERGQGFLPNADIEIGIIQTGQGRTVSLKAGTDLGNKIIFGLQEL